MNADATGYQSTSRPVTALCAALLVVTAQADKQLLALASIPINPAVDRLDANAHLGVVGIVLHQLCRNYLWRPVIAQFALDATQQWLVGMASKVTRLLSALHGLLVCTLMPIDPGWDERPIAFEFTTDGGVGAAHR